MKVKDDVCGNNTKKLLRQHLDRIGSINLKMRKDKRKIAMRIYLTHPECGGSEARPGKGQGGNGHATNDITEMHGRGAAPVKVHPGFV